MEMTVKNKLIKVFGKSSSKPDWFLGKQEKSGNVPKAVFNLYILGKTLFFLFSIEFKVSFWFLHQSLITTLLSQLKTFLLTLKSFLKILNVQPV